jgi:hypothetical protein
MSHASSTLSTPRESAACTKPRGTAEPESPEMRPVLRGDRERLLDRSRKVCLRRGAVWYKRNIGSHGLTECSTDFLRTLLARGA